ncbi:hypothetical protein ACLOJK_031474 [Asimina triloba]
MHAAATHENSCALRLECITAGCDRICNFLTDVMVIAIALFGHYSVDLNRSNSQSSSSTSPSYSSTCSGSSLPCCCYRSYWDYCLDLRPSSLSVAISTVEEEAAGSLPDLLCSYCRDDENAALAFDLGKPDAASAGLDDFPSLELMGFTAAAAIAEAVVDEDDDVGRHRQIWTR